MTAWLIDVYPEKSNTYLGAFICEYTYLLDLPMPWVCGLRFQPTRHIPPGELRKLIDSME